jgi:anti-sigma regulatory factor (Ser/Thr protein kinase)
MRRRGRPASFRHEAVLYRGRRGFLRSLVPFVRDSLNAGEPILVAVGQRKIDLLRGELGPESSAEVSFVDIEGVGRNPARIIQVWRDWADRQAGDRFFRGVSESIWPGRTPEEIVECEYHESLINAAFEDGPPWWLVCPYDTAHLDRRVIDRAMHAHPLVSDRGRYRTTHEAPADYASGMLADPLPEPQREAERILISMETLRTVRAKVRTAGARSGLSAARCQDFAVAVNEAAANSILHGGGTGVLRIWREKRSLICEVGDNGRIEDHLLGRARPVPDAKGGAGVWLINQTCDLVQIRSVPGGGAVVRMRMWLDRR